MARWKEAGWFTSILAVSYAVIFGAFVLVSARVGLPMGLGLVVLVLAHAVIGWFAPLKWWTLPPPFLASTTFLLQVFWRDFRHPQGETGVTGSDFGVLVGVAFFGVVAGCILAGPLALGGWLRATAFRRPPYP